MQVKSKRAIQAIITALTFLSDKLLPFLFFGTVIFGFDKPYIATLTVLTAALHELGHIAALIAIRSSLTLPKAGMRGFLIKYGGLISYLEEIFLLISGPLINLAVSLLFLPFSGSSEYLFAFALINLFTAACSLLPIEGYDGYGILSVVCRFFGRDGLKKSLDCLSLILSAVICLLSLYFIESYGEAFWIFFTFLYSLLLRIKKSFESGNFEN